jgi:hypothetical protein
MQMKRKIAAGVAATALTFGLGAGVAGAGGPPQGAGDGGKPVGVECMQHGLGLLQSLGSPSQVSQSAIGLPLNQVLALHRNDPAAAAVVLTSLGLPAGPCAVDA